MSHISRKASQIGRTKGWVAEALIQAALAGEYATLTISDLCQKAGIGRQTFYRHYNSKDEVILDIGSQMFDQLLETLAPVDGPPADMYKINLESLRLMKKQERVMGLVKIPELKHLISEAMDANTDQLIARLPILGRMDPMQYQFNYWAWKGVLFEWARQDFKQSPEEIARLIAQWTNQAVGQR